MNILDESIAADQREFLRSWRIAAHHIGYDFGRSGTQDADIIPLLHRTTRPTFFTPDLDFYRRSLCHARYCLVYLHVTDDEVAQFIRRVLHHKEFNTEAKRMGTVIRVTPSELTVWRLHAEQEIAVAWNK